MRRLSERVLLGVGFVLFMLAAIIRYRGRSF